MLLSYDINQSRIEVSPHKKYIFSTNISYCFMVIKSRSMKIRLMWLPFPFYALFDCRGVVDKRLLNDLIQIQTGTYIHLFCIIILLCSFTILRITDRLTHFTSLVSFYTPWKQQKTRGFCNVFRNYRKRLVVWNGLISLDRGIASSSVPSHKNLVCMISMSIAFIASI